MKQGADRPERGETERGSAQPEGKHRGEGQKNSPYRWAVRGMRSMAGSGVEKASANGGATGR